MEADHLITANVSSGSASDEDEIYNVSRSGRDISVEIVESRLRQKFEEQKFLIQSLTTERDRLARNSETKALKAHSLNCKLQELQQIHQKELESLKELHERQAIDNIAIDGLVQRAIFGLQDHWVHRTIDAEAIKLLLKNLRQDARDLVPSKYSVLSVLEEVMLMVDECYTIKDQQLANKDLIIYRLQNQIAAQDEFQHYLNSTESDGDETLNSANSRENNCDDDHITTTRQATATSELQGAEQDALENGDIPVKDVADTQESYIVTLQEQIVCYRRLLHYNTLKCNLLTQQVALKVEQPPIETDGSHLPAAITENLSWRDFVDSPAASSSSHDTYVRVEGQARGCSAPDISSPRAYISFLLQQLADKTNDCNTLTKQNESFRTCFVALCEERDETQERLSKLSEYEAQIERLTHECSEHKAKLDEALQIMAENHRFNQSQHDELLRCRAEYLELSSDYDTVTKFMAKLEGNLLAVTKEFADEDIMPVHSVKPERAQNSHQEGFSANLRKKDDSNQYVRPHLTERLEDLIESSPPAELQKAYEELFSQDKFPSIHNMDQREMNASIGKLEVEIKNLKTQLADANLKHREEQQKWNKQERENRRTHANMTNMISQLKTAFQNLYTVKPEVFDQASSSTLREILKIFDIRLILPETKRKTIGSCLDFSMLNAPCRTLDEWNHKEVETALLDLLMYLSELQNALEGIVGCTKVLIPFDHKYILEPTYDFVRRFVEPLQSHLTYNAVHHKGRTLKLASILDFKLEMPWQMTVVSVDSVLKDLTQVLPHALAVQSELQSRDYNGFCKELEDTSDPCELMKISNSLITRHIIDANPGLKAEFAQMKDSRKLRLLHDVIETHKTTMATMLIQLNHAPTTVLSTLRDENSFMTGMPLDLVPVVIQGFNKAITREVSVDKVKVKLEDLLANFKKFSVVIEQYANKIEMWEHGCQAQPRKVELSTVIEEDTGLESEGRKGSHDGVDEDINYEDEDDDDDDVDDDVDGEPEVVDPTRNHQHNTEHIQRQTDHPQASIEKDGDEEGAEELLEEHDGEDYDHTYSSNDADSEDNSLPYSNKGKFKSPVRAAIDEEYRRGVWD